MEASSPLSSAPSGFGEDDDYRNGTSPVSLAKAPICHAEPLPFEDSPRSKSLLPETKAPPSGPLLQTDIEAPGQAPEASQQKQPVIETKAPADHKPSVTADRPAETASTSASAKEPEPPSYTANAFALVPPPPATPQPASSMPPQPGQQQDTPKAPHTPKTPASTETSVKKSPGSRGRPSKTPAPSTPPRRDTSNVPGSIGPTTAANGADAASMPQNAGRAGSAARDTRTTTRSGRRVNPPKNVLQDLSPSQPPASVSVSKLLGRASTTVSATASAVASAVAVDIVKSPRAPRTAASPTVTAAVMRRRKADAARWKTGFLLSSARSPLTRFDLRAILLRPETWDALSSDEQAEVLSLFPSTTNVSDAGTAAARPDVASLINDNNFRHDCARYQNDLADGFFERKWLAEAFEAHAMRHNGAFDDHVIREFEKAWGVQVPAGLRGGVKTGDRSVSPSHSDGASADGPGDKLLPATLKRSRPLVAKDEPVDEAQGEEKTEADEEAPATPVPKRKRAAAKKPKPSADTEKAGEGPATNGTEDGNRTGQTGQTGQAAQMADAAAAAALTTTGPSGALSLRLGSPVVDEKETDAASGRQDEAAPQPESAGLPVDAAGPPPAKAKTPSPRTRKAPATRKATAAPTRRGSQRLAPNVEDGKGEAGSKDGQ